MSTKRSPYMEAAERELDRLRAERDDWRAAHHERFAELQAVCRDRDGQVDTVVRLRAALQQARDLLTKNQPHSIADTDGDAWEAWAVIEKALNGPQVCPECGTEHWREDSDLCSSCVLADVPV